MDQAARIRAMMERFLRETKGDHSFLKPLGSGLWISNQKPIQSDPFGKIKFETGRETITVYKNFPNRKRDIIARLHEGPDGPVFEDLAISRYLDALLKVR